MGGGSSANADRRQLLFYFHQRGIDFQGTMLSDDIERDRLKKAEKFCRRILELSNQEKFVDVEVKMEAGRVTIWYEKVKVKP
ncbi:MAG: hypothetical protein WBK67_03140 [Minisyncoccales bacterium]|jgi:hypothetical protein